MKQGEKAREKVEGRKHIENTHMNFIDHAPPPGYWAFLRNQNDAEFLDRLNVSTAQHACMVSELCLRYEHEITIRENFEKKFVRGSEIIQQRDSEVAALKSKLERLEGEALDALTLRKRVSKLDTAATAKSEELTSLNVQNVELLSLHGEVAGEAKMRAEFMSVQDAKAQHIARFNAELDVRITKLNHDMDIELYPHMLTGAISMAINKGIQEGLEAGIEHGKANRSLAELESLKDSPLELLVSSLTLEGDHGEDDPTPEFRKLQLVSNQVTVLVYYERSGSRDPGSISHEVLLSDALTSRSHGEKHKKVSLDTCCPFVAMPYVSSQETYLVVAGYQVSSVAIFGDGAATTEPHDDLFDTTVQDKPVDC
ncbi:hypothetical protein Tco_0593666 [Tanacetum coccineum]